MTPDERDETPDSRTEARAPDPSVDEPGAVDQAAAATAALRRMTRSTSTARRKSRGTRRGGPAFSDARDPLPVGRALEALLSEQGWQDQSAVATLMGEWEQIVGRDLAEHVRAVSFHEGELVLQADSTAWATQVRLLLPAVQRAIDERIGGGIVLSIRINGPQAPSWTAGPRRVKGRGPRDTYG